MRQIDALKSPRFTQISTFARLPICESLNGVKALFIGIPFDDATTYRPGARFGPSGIRQGSRLLRPYNMYLDVYPFDDLNACDRGDVNVVPGYIDDTMKVIEKDIDEIVKSKIVPFIAGGDHSITLPILRSMAKNYGKVNVIHFDSHFDFWDSYWGKKYTHGTWLRRSVEEGLISNVIQVGIRGPQFTKDDFEEGKKLGVKSFNIREVKYSREKVISTLNSLNGPTYISLDIDVVDPAFAPGTGTPEVGGLTSFETLEMLRELKLEKIVGFDVVEVSPPYDISEITSMLAANIIYEGMSLISFNK
ncbi:agmatinase [Candidatus Acidianus copahuensis]|uniref:Agmatinase n=1 Tax=Candidatus Acidianus copahuensis TaxID=1160895 RepID=A0A031LRH1_9CREN|nr:agmatinase [Candidatus Acidianus copahuensis]EZQ10350.1 agmatinase [Candidatus Acidianus copahuensis]